MVQFVVVVAVLLCENFELKTGVVGVQQLVATLDIVGIMKFKPFGRCCLDPLPC